MRRAGLAAAALLFATPAVSAESNSVKLGRQLAARHCANCHAIGKAGSSPMSEAPPFRTLSDRYPLESLEEALAEGILTGHPAMPEFRLTPQQIENLLNYLRTVQVKHSAGRDEAARRR